MDVSSDFVKEVKSNQLQLKTQHFFAVLALLLFCLGLGLVFFFWQRQITIPARREQQVQTALQLIEQEQVVGEFPLKVSGSSSLYHFYSVLDEEVQLETPFEITYVVGGETMTLTITTLAKVYYLDAQGVQQMIYVPFFSHDAQRKIWHIIDGGTGQTDSKEQFEEWMAAYRRGALDKGLGPMTIAGRPNLNPGQIMFLGFGMEANPLLSSGAKDFFGDAMGPVFTQEQLEEFARTGDSSGLPKVPGYGPLLIPLSEGESSRLQNQLEEKNKTR